MVMNVLARRAIDHALVISGLLEEVGEQWCSPVDRIERHYGDDGGRCRHEGARVEAPEHLVGVETRREVKAPGC